MVFFFFKSLLAALFICKKLIKCLAVSLLERIFNGVFFMQVSEALRKRLLEEELRLRAKQPTAWTKIKYRKNIKPPKKKKGRKKK